MEKKTNKEKLAIFKFLRKSVLSKAIAFDKIGSNYALSGNSTKICLLGYFCMQNSYLRWKQFKILRFSWKMQKKKKKKIEKWLVLVISVNFLRFSLKLFSIISEKVIKNVFRWKRTQINKNEQFSNFWENQLYGKAFDKIGGNYALSANSIKICLLGYFCMQNSYLRWKQFKILRFSWKMQKNRKMISFGNFC